MADDGQQPGDAQAGDAAQPPPVVQLPRRGALQVTSKERVQEHRETTRSWVAKALMWLLLGTVAAIVGLLWFHRIVVNDALSLLAPITAVVGTALGFYFGGHKDDP